MKKNILIINTGGTISSLPTKTGLIPKSGVMSGLLEKLQELKHPKMPKYKLIEFSPLIDSSNLDINHWQEIASLIKEHYSLYDGFVILHGTDTMAFTASALSFMLVNLAKPVILTGSQLPLSILRTDAKDNIITSLLLASSGRLHEVAIYFNQKLLRGNRAQKISSDEFSAFASPNCEVLATCGIDIKWNRKILCQKPQDDFHYETIEPQRIAIYRLFPGQDERWLEVILRTPFDALILQTYGSGNAPTRKSFVDLLMHASTNGVIVCNVSQCQQAYVDMSAYETGHLLQQAGVISGYDMTIETAHVKLSYLLSHYNDSETIKRLMQTNLRGELTPREDK